MVPARAHSTDDAAWARFTVLRRVPVMGRKRTLAERCCQVFAMWRPPRELESELIFIASLERSLITSAMRQILRDYPVSAAKTENLIIGTGNSETRRACASSLSAMR